MARPPCAWAINQRKNLGPELELGSQQFLHFCKCYTIIFSVMTIKTHDQGKQCKELFVPLQLNNLASLLVAEAGTDMRISYYNLQVKKLLALYTIYFPFVSNSRIFVHVTP